MLLLIEAVTKAFSAREERAPALAAIDFHVGEGEFVCLVGPSGCGKSTVLALIAGLLRPTSGRIMLDGAIISKAGVDRGVVFQHAHLFPWLTVYDNVTFGLTLKVNRALKQEASGVSLRAHADSLLEAVGLAAFRDRYPRQLSGGMRQRAALVRALVTKPRILLMDEPFGALDAQTREEMQELLMHLCARHGTTVLFVTHDVEEALILSDRVLVMQSQPGTIIADVTVALPRPRPFESRANPKFIELRSRIFDLLHRRDRRSIPPAVLS